MKKLISTVASGAIMLSGTSVVLAASYENEGKTVRSNVSLSLELDQELIEIPNPGPSDPIVNPENPPVTNPDIGSFGISYVSDLNFGVQNISSQNEEYVSTFDEAFLNDSQYNHLVVQNFEANNENWSITVEQEGAFIPGSTLTFSPSQSTGSTIELLFPQTLSVTADNGAQNFATEAKGLGVSTILLNSDGVQLSVPANTAVGEYSTTLVWNLVAGV